MSTEPVRPEPGGREVLGQARLFHPFAECPDIVVGRAGARSASFAPDAAAAEPAVLVGAAAGGDTADVATRAEAELLERVSNVLAGRVAERGHAVHASFEELRRVGTAALDPAAWPEAGPEARAARVLWVTGRSLVDDREVLVPAGAAFLRHRPPPGDAAVLRAGSAGVATHVSTAAAVDHALLEVLERDLVWRAWYADGPVSPLVDVEMPGDLAICLTELGLQLTAFVLRGPADTAAVVACLHGPDRTEQSFGARCVQVGSDGLSVEAVGRAVYEALMIRWSMSTAAARRAWVELSSADTPRLPRDALEHAVWAFHGTDALGYWETKASPPSPAIPDRRPLAATLARPQRGGGRHGRFDGAGPRPRGLAGRPGRGAGSSAPSGGRGRPSGASAVRRPPPPSSHRMSGGRMSGGRMRARVTACWRSRRTWSSPFHPGW